MNFAVHAALSGLGVALLSETIALTYLKAGKLKRVLDDYATEGQGLYAIYPSRHQLSVNARAFLDIVIASIKRRVPWDITGVR